jgi:phosphoribosylaminoimidazole-succinocarboxamide synthase
MVLNNNISIIVPIIMESERGLDHANKIHSEIKNKFYDLKIMLVNRICSAHKSSINLIKILNEYEQNNNVLCYITISDKSNILSAFVDGHTSKLVISNPSIGDLNMHDLYSSTSVTPGVAPLVILGASNCALAIVKIAAIRYPQLTCSVNKYHDINRQKLRIMDVMNKYRNVYIDAKKYNQWKENKNNDYLNDYEFVRSGKVRNIYKSTYQDTLLISSSDRLSAFDRHICDIPYKGNILNSISVWWFDQTKDIVPNHLIKQLNSTDIIVKKCKPILIEFVVRGYMTGRGKTSMWYNYNIGVRDYCGNKLKNGMVKNQKLEKCIISPTTKGKTDELISEREILEKGILTQKQWDTCAKYALELFDYGQKKAKENGMMLVDTKYEFGFDKDGEIMLIDEVHTPDSSRYWFKHNYQERFNKGLDPESIDKEIIRKWIKDNYDPYNTSIEIKVIQEMKDLVTRRYIQLYEIITDNSFIL